MGITGDVSNVGGVQFSQLPPLYEPHSPIGSRLTKEFDTIHLCDPCAVTKEPSTQQIRWLTIFTGDNLNNV
jgi:hypothetical protein